MNYLKRYDRFEGIEPFKKKVWHSSPTIHGDEWEYIKNIYGDNWRASKETNIEEVERLTCEKTGGKYAVALSSGMSALHLAIKYAGQKLYGNMAMGHGAIEGKQVFCSDLSFGAAVNPIIYEGGQPVFIDSECETWNMNPQALEKAFRIYPHVKIIVLTHLYGTPGKVDRIKSIANSYGAIIIEDATESLGTTYYDCHAGALSHYGVLSFSEDKIITGSGGGIFITDELHAAEKVRMWSNQSLEKAPWNQYAEVGYNYCMSNLTAGMIRGQYEYLEEHISNKQKIYEQYNKGLSDLPIDIRPVPSGCKPNYWSTCATVRKEQMCRQVRSEYGYLYESENGKSCPMEIVDAIERFNGEARPIWKPLHMQPMYWSCVKI